MLILKTDPSTMQRMMNDSAGRLLAVVDKNGVIVAGNRNDDLIRLMPDATDPGVRGVDVEGVYRGTPRRLDWQDSEITVANQRLPAWLINGKLHLAQRVNLPDHPYRLWVMSPLLGEQRIMIFGAFNGLVSVAMGWALLWVYWRRASRQAEIERTRNETLAMTRALPLGLFRYRIEPDGRGRFVHIGAGARRLFGTRAEGWERSPEDAWRLLGQTENRPPKLVYG